MNKISKNETIEDLQCSGLRLIQSTKGHRFGEDSVLLTNFASSFFINKSRKYRIFDLGCGCGVISMLISSKLPASLITGLDLCEDSINIFKRNIILNGLSDRASSIRSDWKDIRKHAKKGCADIVISNPPYFDPGAGTYPGDTGRKTARVNAESGEDDLAGAASFLLKNGGIGFFIYRSMKLPDLLQSLRKYDLEPVRLKFVQAFPDSAPKSFLLAARKSGRKGGLIVERPLVIFDREGVYSDQTISYYGKTPPMTREELFRDVLICE